MQSSIELFRKSYPSSFSSVLKGVNRFFDQMLFQNPNVYPFSEATHFLLNCEVLEGESVCILSLELPEAMQNGLLGDESMPIEASMH